MVNGGEAQAEMYNLLMQQGKCQRNYFLNSTKTRGRGIFNFNYPGVNIDYVFK